MNNEKRAKVSIPHAFAIVASAVMMIKESKDNKNDPEILRETYNAINITARNFDWSNLTEKKLLESGFSAWNTENPDVGTIYLVPSWLKRYIPDDIRLVSIFGESIDDNSKIDDDERGGYLAYGIIPKTTEDRTSFTVIA